MAGEREQNRELTLSPDTYLYLQNIGKGGLITVNRGPTVVTMTGQDQPVRYDAASRKYIPSTLEQAVQQSPLAKEGDYVVLENPTKEGTFPGNASQQAVEVKKGHKIMIPGPWSEALWPGQTVTVVEGHRLRSNQYLVAMVYNEEAAQENWDKTVVRVQTEDAGASKVQKGLPTPESFAVGTRIVIKGSDVSFYIPCTGVEVVWDEQRKYVREAVTLEQLEYCCLVDENGKKEYPKGPAVVFPKPTQVFETDSKQRRKFRPIELNTINGIHLKVTADFKGPDIESDLSKQRDFEEGEELFVTGKVLSIYYPREEFILIEYGQGNKKHFSTAIPKGEGRYIIKRDTGEIRLERGPKMLLADPRYEIPVRRVLSQEECALMYPGNAEALAYNKDLAEAMAESPSGRSGVISEGDVRKRQARNIKGLTSNIGGAHYLAASSGVGAEDYAPEDVGDEGGATETIRRGTKFTPPRTITLNTKFDGVPKIEIWPGYAVLIVGSEGSRRVAEGPEVVLLQYDEKLGFMELSTGKPKTTDKLYRTSYLCTNNNQVGDEMAFESRDHVKGKVKLSLRVNFEGDSEEEKLKWFSVSNYVKFLTDHVRSIVAGLCKKKAIAEIKADYVSLIRDAILGTKAVAGETSEALKNKRPGLYFEANGMRVVEVEVLAIDLADQAIARLIDQAQHKTVESNIQIEQQERDLTDTKKRERIEQEKLDAQFETKRKRTELQKLEITDSMLLVAKQVELELVNAKGQYDKEEALEKTLDFKANATLERAKKEVEHKFNTDKTTQGLLIEKLDKETSNAVARFEAAKNGLHEVLMSLQREDIAVKLASATNIERYLTGDSIQSAIANLLTQIPSLKTFFDKADNGKPGNRLTQQATIPTSK